MLQGPLPRPYISTILTELYTQLGSIPALPRTPAGQPGQLLPGGVVYCDSNDVQTLPDETARQALRQPLQRPAPSTRTHPPASTPARPHAGTRPSPVLICTGAGSWDSGTDRAVAAADMLEISDEAAVSPQRSDGPGNVPFQRRCTPGGEGTKRVSFGMKTMSICLNDTAPYYEGRTPWL